MVHPLDRHSLDHLLFVPNDQLPYRSVHLQNHVLPRSCLLDIVWPLIKLHAPITAYLARIALAMHRVHPTIWVHEGGQRWARRQGGESNARGLVPAGLGLVGRRMVVVVVLGRRHLPYLAHVGRAMDEQAFVLVTFMVAFDTPILSGRWGGQMETWTPRQFHIRTNELLKSRPLALPTQRTSRSKPTTSGNPHFASVSATDRSAVSAVKSSRTCALSRDRRAHIVGVERLDSMLLLAPGIRRERRIILKVKLPILERPRALDGYPFTAWGMGNAPMLGEDVPDRVGRAWHQASLRIGGLCPAPNRRELPVEPACDASFLAGDP
jgi:hypothetical protein